MKKIISIAAAAGLLQMLFVSCNRNVSPEVANVQDLPDGMGIVKVELQTGALSEIKAGTPYVDELPYEKSINSVQLFFFDSDDNLLRAENIGTRTSATFQIPVGVIEVWALVNFKDITKEISTLSELNQYQVLLADNSLDEGKGFLMYDASVVEVTANAENKIQFVAKRYASRIALASVTNSIPEGYDVKLERAFIANAVSKTVVDFSTDNYVFANPQGRVGETPLEESHIIDGVSYESDIPDLLYKDFPAMTFAKGTSFTPTKPYCFYVLPNGGGKEMAGFDVESGVEFDLSEALYPTTIVLVAALNGTEYYYPIPINNIEYNKSYTVYVTLLGPGSQDPNSPVVKSSVDVELKVQPWRDGGVISSEI